MSAPSEAPEHNSNAADNAVFEECSGCGAAIDLGPGEDLCAKCWDASAPSEGAPTPVGELFDGLRKRARDCRVLANKYRATRQKVDAARCSGKAQAYEHAAELLMATLGASGEPTP